MSRKLQPQFPDARSAIINNLAGDAAFCEGSTVPSDTTPGFAVGCIFLKRAGVAGSQVYINEGTNLSCDFNATGFAVAVAPSSVASTGAITSSSPTAGLGYATGAGGTVTQASSRSTAVTLNTVSGNIVLVSAAGSATPFSFTLTNSAIALGDTIILNQKSGTDKYTTQVVTAVAAGSCQITLANASGTTTEQPVFNFNVIKGVAA